MRPPRDASPPEKLRDHEVECALRRLARGEDAQQVLEAFSRRFTARLMHRPTVRLYDLLGRQRRA